MRETEPVDRGFEQRFRMIAAKPRLCRRVAALAEAPRARRRHAVPGEAVVSGECVGRIRLAAPRQIRRARTQHAPLRRKHGCDEARVLERADTHREIDVGAEPRALQIDHAVGQHEVDLQRRMTLHERGQRGHQVPPAERRRTVDAQQPARLVVLAVQVFLQAAQLGQHPRRAPVQQLSGLGGPQRMRGAMQEADAELCLEPVDAPRDRRRGDTQPAGGRREALLVDHVDEQCQVRGKEIVHSVPSDLAMRLSQNNHPPLRVSASNRAD
ncbi:lysR family transcriptional regulator domain protein [Burkholderia cepacia]|nr:lysR family transcriptional regulator domain protein [Burkholderia cepacia]